MSLKISASIFADFTGQNSTFPDFALSKWWMTANGTNTESGTAGLIMSRGRYRKYRRHILQISSTEEKFYADENSLQSDPKNIN